VSVAVPGCPGCEALSAAIAELQALVAAQGERIRELEARLHESSRNSSKPPSSDPPAERGKRAGKPGSGRKRGGQPGHQGKSRVAFPPEMVDHREDCIPTECAGCGTAIPAAADADAPPPQLHQVADLPEKLKLHVTEYRLHARTCRCCGKQTWAKPPRGAPSGNWGAGVQALAALLVGYFKLSRRRTVEFFVTLFGYSPCLGTISALETATVAALEPVVDEAVQTVQQASAVNSDETGWRKARDRPTLWVVVAGLLAVFRIGRRDGKMFEKLLPPGVLRVVTSDRYAVYERVAAAWRQLCWAHLRRNFQGIVDLGTPTGRLVGNWALAETGKMFHLWHRFRRGEIARDELQAGLVPIQQAFRTLLATGSAGACKKTAGLCASLEAWWDSLWTFADKAGVEPTNNAAERALRGAVIWRKTSFGHQSEAGRRFVETMLTVGGSLRLQERPALPFVRSACEARLTGTKPPSLLPDPT
jgi:transposase